MNTVPKAISDTIAALKSERAPLAARLDAIDLAIENLSRVYGLHGMPQPLPLMKPRRKSTRTAAPVARESGDAQARRDCLAQLIEKSAMGLTIADIRKHTPKMKTQDRSNALYTLKVAGVIRRAGNTWVKAS